jgi:hypothetical protein
MAEGCEFLVFWNYDVTKEPYPVPPLLTLSHETGERGLKAT